MCYLSGVLSEGSVFFRSVITGKGKNKMSGDPGVQVLPIGVVHVLLWVEGSRAAAVRACPG